MIGQDQELVHETTVRRFLLMKEIGCHVDIPRLVLGSSRSSARNLVEHVRMRFKQRKRTNALKLPGVFREPLNPIQSVFCMRIRSSSMFDFSMGLSKHLADVALAICVCTAFNVELRGEAHMW